MSLLSPTAACYAPPFIGGARLLCRHRAVALNVHLVPALLLLLLLLPEACLRREHPVGSALSSTEARGTHRQRKKDGCGGLLSPDWG